MKNNIHFGEIRLCILSAILACSFNGAAQLDLPSKKLDSLFFRFSKAHHFSGVVLAVKDGQVIYHKGFGFANKQTRVDNGPATVIGVASITKMMTGVILNRLIEENKISPDDRISKYIPDFPNGEKITIQILRSHRSGIPHRVTKENEETVHYTSAQLINKIKSAEFAFEPGAERLYSSAGYSVLARVLEIASGKTYSQLLSDYVFNPAGMNSSFDASGKSTDFTHEYFLGPNEIIEAPHKDYSFLLGAGSVFSTATDIYNFAKAILDGRLGETTKSMNVRNDELVGNGFTNGHFAFFKFNRSKNYGFVVLSNLASGANDMLIPVIEGILDNQPVSLPSVPQQKVLQTDIPVISDFEGTYRSANGMQLTITGRDKYLYSSEFRLYPTGKDSFYDFKTYGRLLFLRGSNGKISQLEWTTVAGTLQFRKID